MIKAKDYSKIFEQLGNFCIVRRTVRKTKFIIVDLVINVLF